MEADRISVGHRQVASPFLPILGRGANAVQPREHAARRRSARPGSTATTFRSFVVLMVSPFIFVVLIVGPVIFVVLIAGPFNSWY